MFTAIGRTAPYDNSELIKRSYRLRHEKAQLLGKRHFADWILSRRMAKKGTTALRFIEDLHDRILKAFQRECSEVERFKSEQAQQPFEPLNPWKMAYWSRPTTTALFRF